MMEKKDRYENAIILPYGLLAKFNNAANNGKLRISLESRYQPHRRSTSLCSTFFSLTHINVYCSRVSTPPTLKV